MPEPRPPPPSPPLPLSEQVLAWLLLALGLEEGSVPSRSTIKTARKGGLIARRWDDLVNLALRTLGAKPDPERHRVAREILRHWDETVGALPPAAELSLAERLHAPFQRWIPEVGVRLGALAAIVAMQTGKPVDECLWIVEPLDRKFFGRAVGALLAHRFPKLTVEERKAEVARKVDRRTVERWFSGETAEPQVQDLLDLAGVLGDRATTILRAARMAARLRADLRGWIGDEMMCDLAGAVATIGRFAARQLATPDGVRPLFGWFHEELTGAHADDAHAMLRQFLWPKMREWSATELTDRFATARERTPPPGLHAWALATTLLIAHPGLVAVACEAHGAGMAAVVGATDFARYVEQQWMFRAVVHAIAEGGDMSVADRDGTPRTEAVSEHEHAREAARRWRSTSLRFTRSPSDDDDAADADLMTALLEVCGIEALQAFGGLSEQLGEHVMMLAAPLVESTLADEDVMRSGALCMARARRLAEAGDRDLALRWFARARERGAPRSSAEADDIIAFLAAIAHSVLDDVRKLRAMLRDLPHEDRPEDALGGLAASATLAERLVAQILEVGDGPDGTAALLGVLVVAVPLTLRVALLRDEIAGTDGALEAAQVIVARAAVCLDQQPAQGRGWAILALWRRCCGLDHDEVTKNAVHYGAGGFLESEWARVTADVGLTEDAG